MTPLLFGKTVISLARIKAAIFYRVECALSEEVLVVSFGNCANVPSLPCAQGTQCVESSPYGIAAAEAAGGGRGGVQGPGRDQA